MPDRFSRAPESLYQTWQSMATPSSGHGTLALRLLHLQLAVAGGDSARGRAFVGVELGPNGEVVGDFQRLIEVQVKLLGEVEDAPLACELSRGRSVENDVIVLGVLTGVGVRVHHDRVDAVDAAQVAEVLIVDIEI